MSDSRFDTLIQMLKEDPDDSFTKYALGLEYASKGDLENARKIFEELRISDPKYCAVYYQLGKVYEKLGDVQMAKKAYEQGILVTTQQGEQHTRDELEQAVNELL